MLLSCFNSLKDPADFIITVLHSEGLFICIHVGTLFFVLYLFLHPISSTWDHFLKEIVFCQRTSFLSFFSDDLLMAISNFPLWNVLFHHDPWKFFLTKHRFLGWPFCFLSTLNIPFHCLPGVWCCFVKSIVSLSIASLKAAVFPLAA